MMNAFASLFVALTAIALSVVSVGAHAQIALAQFTRVAPSDAEKNSERASQEAHRLTIITPGFRSPTVEDHVPNWARELERTLKESGRAGDIAIVDWTAESNDAAPGWAESVGDELFARIMWKLIRARGSMHVHLIGHSRGVVVSSEAQKRLFWYGRQHPAVAEAIERIDVTMLDPHPANGASGFSAEESLAASFFARMAQQFKRLVRDPEPQVWPNTSYAEVYFQQSTIEQLAEDAARWSGLDQTLPEPMIVAAARVSLLVNLHGLDPDAPFSRCLDRCRDVSSETVPWRAANGRHGHVRCSHTTIAFWYIHHAKQDRSVSSDRVTDDKIISHRNAIQPDAAKSDSVFNGDFRYSGQIDHPAFRLFREHDRIPGWHSNRELHVTDEGRLRLAASANRDVPSDTASVTHNPMFIPPDATALALDISQLLINGEQDTPPTFNAYLIPIKDGADKLMLDLDRATWKTLSRWQLTSQPDIPNSLNLKDEETRTISLPLPIERTAIGHVAAIYFELTTPPSSKAILEIDNVRWAAIDENKSDVQPNAPDE